MSTLMLFGSIVGEEYSLEYFADEVFPWIIGTGFLYLVQVVYLVPGKSPTVGLRTWLASIQIYLGAAIDVLACYASLLRINFSYLGLAIFPFIVIFFICLLCMRHSQLWGRRSKKRGKQKSRPRNNKGPETTLTLGKLYKVAHLVAHFMLYVSGLVGDADHDGNNYDIFNFCLFLTCMLQNLTIMMMRLPATVSRGIAPASQLLNKASLVLLLLTAHMVAINAFGNKVVLVLLLEVAPPLLWFSLHLDRRTSVINVEKLKDSEDRRTSIINIVLWAVVVAVCGRILVVRTDKLLFYWAGWSCLASAVMTHLIVLVLNLWPEEKARPNVERGRGKIASVATLSFNEVLDLLTFWGNFLLKAAAGMFALRTVAWLKSIFGP